MKLFIFCVRDSATDQFGNPMFLVNEGQAIRSFSDEVNREDKDNMLCKHCDDFALYSCGTFDTGNGVFYTEAPSQVVTGKQVRVRE